MEAGVPENDGKISIHMRRSLRKDLSGKTLHHLASTGCFPNSHSGLSRNPASMNIGEKRSCSNGFGKYSRAGDYIMGVTNCFYAPEERMPQVFRRLQSSEHCHGKRQLSIRHNEREHLLVARWTSVLDP